MLAYAAQSRKMALDALLVYLDRGGATNLSPSEFIESCRKLIPDSLEGGIMPEFGESQSFLLGDIQGLITDSL